MPPPKLSDSVHCARVQGQVRRSLITYVRTTFGRTLMCRKSGLKDQGKHPEVEVWGVGGVGFG